MDWYNGAAILIASLSLFVSFATFVRGEQRERRRAVAQDRARLGLSSERLSDSALLVDVSYLPLGDHTRYRAVMVVTKPANAMLSEPGWEDHSTPAFFVMPSPAFDPKAKQSRTVILELTGNGPYAKKPGVGARAVAHAPGGLGVLALNIEIQDIATGATVLTTKETLTA